MEPLSLAHRAASERGARLPIGRVETERSSEYSFYTPRTKGGVAVENILLEVLSRNKSG